MSENILDQYGRVTIYTEATHPAPMYHVDGGVDPNPYGNLLLHKHAKRAGDDPVCPY